VNCAIIPTPDALLEHEPNSESITQLHVDKLTEYVQQLRDAVGACEKQRRRRCVRRGIAQVRLVYLLIAAPLRKWVDSILGWRPAGVVIGTMIIGATFMVTSLSWRIALFGIVVGAVVSFSVFYGPSDSRMAEDSERLRDELTRLRLESDEGTQHVVGLRANLATASEKQLNWAQLLKTKQYRESEQYRRQQLLKRDWKALRSVPFEKFLEEVLRELGYVVETTRVTGDQGADLIVSKDGHRTAIQVKGYFSSVANSAVQEAHTAMAYYKCEACVVITNSRFTPAAKDVAGRVGCVLIDEDALPVLIKGNCDLRQLHLSAKAKAEPGNIGGA
jgi:HJR/Mrr/RecB family endonuclease